jgi:signal transduction histidine kinase
MLKNKKQVKLHLFIASCLVITTVFIADWLNSNISNYKLVANKPLCSDSFTKKINVLKAKEKNQNTITFTIDSVLLRDYNMIIDVSGLYYSIQLNHKEIAQNRNTKNKHFLGSNNYIFLSDILPNTAKVVHVSIHYTSKFYFTEPLFFIIHQSIIKQVYFTTIGKHAIQNLLYILLTLFFISLVFLSKDTLPYSITILHLLICFKIFQTGYIWDVCNIKLPYFYEIKHLIDFSIFALFISQIPDTKEKPRKTIIITSISAFFFITSGCILSQNILFSYSKGLFIFSVFITTLYKLFTNNLISVKTNYFFNVLLGLVAYFLLVVTHVFPRGTLTSIASISNIAFSFTSMYIMLKYTYGFLRSVTEYHKKDTALKRISLLKNIGHDLKTPVTIIKTNNQILEHYPSLMGDEINMLIYGTLQSITDLDLMVNNINALINDGEMSLDESLSMNELLSGLNNKYNAYCASKSIVFITKTNNQDVVIQTNRLLLLRVINNLIDNAIKYNTKNGKVQVEYFMKTKKILVIEISDDGIGMTTKQIEQIFTPFYRAEQSRSIAGLGLGLTVVKQLIECLEGKIMVTSTLNEGSQFTIYLNI